MLNNEHIMHCIADHFLPIRNTDILPLDLPPQLQCRINEPVVSFGKWTMLTLTPSLVSPLPLLAIIFVPNSIYYEYTNSSPSSGYIPRTSVLPY
jgi:hypothetical protein